MGEEYADNSPGKLRDGVGDGVAGGDASAGAERKRHGGIEMGARNRPKHRDEHDQHGARRQRVGKECERFVTAGQPLAHDAGADDSRQQQCRAERLRGEPARQSWLAHLVGSGVGASVRPIASRRFCSESLSSEASGRLVKMPMR